MDETKNAVCLKRPSFNSANVFRVFYHHLDQQFMYYVVPFERIPLAR